MKPAELDQVIAELKAKQPFQPFIIEMESGDKFTVERPEMLHYYAGGGTYFWPNGELDFIDAEYVQTVKEVQGQA